MLMCISGGLEGLKTKNVEKVFVFKAFLEVRLPPTDRLTERAGGVREGRGEGSPPPRDQRLGGLGIGRVSWTVDHSTRPEAQGLGG